MLFDLSLFLNYDLPLQLLLVYFWFAFICLITFSLLLVTFRIFWKDTKKKKATKSLQKYRKLLKRKFLFSWCSVDGTATRRISLELATCSGSISPFHYYQLRPTTHHPPHHPSPCPNGIWRVWDWIIHGIRIVLWCSVCTKIFWVPDIRGDVRYMS